jgi:hypothetical protein
LPLILISLTPISTNPLLKNVKPKLGTPDYRECVKGKTKRRNKGKTKKL